MAIKGFIFDFDGLILDTETPEYQAWQEVFQLFGTDLPLDKWAQAIGSTIQVFDPIDYLEIKTNQKINKKDLRSQHLARSLEIIYKQPVLPGVKKILLSAKEAGYRIGLASSSSCEWVTSHLQRLGLLHFFEVIFGSDDVEQVKPNPELYLRAVTALDLKPDEAIASEDSPNGIKAAKTAGLFCVAIPNDLTCQLNIQEADLIISSFAEVTLTQILDSFYKTEKAKS